MLPAGRCRSDSPTPPVPMGRLGSAADDRATPAAALPDSSSLLSVGELKRHSLRDSLRRIHDRASSILLFSLQWKDLEDHYSAAEASLKCRSEELASLESSVVRKFKETGRWARLLGDRVEGKFRVLEEKVGGLAVIERGFVREVEERLKVVEELERRVEREGAVVCEEMRRRGEELEGLFENVRIKEEMLERRDRDLGCREKILENVKSELEEGMRGVGLKERELEEALRQVVSREKEFESREKERGAAVREIEERMAEIVSREKEFESREKERGAAVREIEEKMAEIVSREKVVGERAKRAEMKSAESEGKLRELSLKRKELDEKLDRVRLVEEDLVRRGREMASIEEEIQIKLQVVELKEKMFEDWRKEIESKKKDIEERLKEVRLKEKSLAECSKEVEQRYEESNKICEKKMTELKMIEKILEERANQIEEKEKILAECSKEVEHRYEESNKICEKKMTELKMIEKSLEEHANQIEEKEREVNRVILGADLKKKIVKDPKKANQEPRKVSGHSVDRSPVTQGDTKGELAKQSALAEGERMLDGEPLHDGKALQIFLTKNWDANGAFRHKVSKIIKASPYPARLVLDALQAFSPSCNKRDNSEANCNVYRKEGCLLLLEELRNISPEIGITEKVEALMLSFIWSRTIRVAAQVENLFNLLAAYKIAYFHSADTLLKHVQIVRYSRKMPELCRVLGFTDKIPGFIQDLVKFNNLPLAIRFINAFKLNDMFPVEPLINKCIGDSTVASDNKSNSMKAQKASKTRKTDLIALMECIEEYQIRSKHTERIKEIIFSLGGENQSLEIGANRVDRSCCSTKLTASSPATAPLNVNSVADTTSGVLPNCHLSEQPKVTAPVKAIPSIIDAAKPMHHLLEQDEQTGQGKPSEFKKSGSNELSGEVDWRSLNIIFGGEVDCDNARENAYKLLCGLPDPARLVLDTLKDNVSSNITQEEDFKLGMPSKVCIQLMEVLRRVSPAISHKLHEDAKVFAVTWKSKLKARADDYMGIACFLLFLSAFKLSPAFDAGEILGLLDPASWRKHVLHTFDILGFKDAIPDFIQRLVDKNHCLYAIKYAHAFGMEDKFPFEPLLKHHMTYWEKKAADLCKETPGSPLAQTNAVETMLTVTRVVIKCVNFYKLESRSLMKELDERLQQLSKQKADLAMKLKDSPVLHSGGSSSPASEQEMEEEPTVTGNSPSSCSNDYAPVSANVPTSMKASLARASSASPKDGARVPAHPPTLEKPATVPSTAPSASSTSDAKSGCSENTGVKRPMTSAPQDHNPQLKRQAQDRPCWAPNAHPPPYLDQAWRNRVPPFPPYPPVHHPYHHPPYQLGPSHVRPSWPAPYPNPGNPYGGPPPRW